MSRHGDTPEATQKGKDTGAFREEKKNPKPKHWQDKAFKNPLPFQRLRFSTSL